MKKLSKVLSLVLVIAMVFSLCVIGASASYADFTDTDKITDTYKEAVNVMTGMGIIDGMNATTFDAQGNFTRAQAAKIIAYMQLGVTAASALKGTGTGYKDVAATAWYAPYVAYCTQQGIIGGYGNGNFGPNDALTGYQFAKMLLCAVGYGVNKEYTGNSWSINVAKDALQKGVFTDVLSASTNSVITREQATQMAFNTLTGIPTVTYSTLYGDYIYYGTGTVNNLNGVTLGQKAYGLKIEDSAVVLANASTKKTLIDADNGNITQVWSDSTTNVGTIDTTEIMDLRFDTGIDMIGHMVNVYYHVVKGQLVPYAVVDQAAKAATVVVPTGKTVAECAAAAGFKKAAVSAYVSTGYGDFATTKASVTTTPGAYIMVSNNELNAVDFVVTVPTQYVDTVTAVNTNKTTEVTTVATTGTHVNGLTNDSTKALFCPAAAKLAVKDVIVAFKAGDVWNYEVAKAVTGTLTKIDTTATPVQYTVGGTAYTWSTATDASVAPTSTANAAEAVYFVNAANQIVYTTATVNTNYAYVIDAAVTVTPGLNSTATVTAKVMAALSNGTMGTYDLKLTKTVTAGVTSYSVAGTEVYNSGNPSLDETKEATTAIKTALNTKCFCYTLSDTTLALSALNGVTQTASTTEAITTGTTTNAGKFLNSDTVYVVYNAAKGTATAVTGNTNLNYSLAVGAAMLYDANNIVKCVFSGTGTNLTSTVKAYIYVDVTKVVKTSDASHTYFAYNGIAADGSTVVVTATDVALATTGIYTYENDKSVTEATNLVAAYNNTSVTATAPVAYGTATVAGSLVKVGAVGTYNITADTKIVYVDSTKSEVNGNNVTVVVSVANSAPTSNAVVIYVVG